MLLFSGAQFLQPWPLLGPMTAFTVMVWLRTTTAASQVVYGAISTVPTARISLTLLTGPARLQINLQAGSLARIGTVSPAALFDGEWHCVVHRRDAAGGVRVWVDAVELASTWTSSTLAGEAVDVLREMALGALNNNGTKVGFVTGRLGEFAVWPAALPVEAIVDISRGFSHTHWSPPPLAYCPGGGLGQAITPPGVLNPGFTPPADVAHPAIGHLPLDVCAAAAAARLGGYDVFVGVDEPADPVAAPPVRRLAADAESFDLPVAVLAPARRNHVSLYAVNRSGRSLVAETVVVPTDVGGEPQLYPRPVTALRAVPRAGGWLDITWEYDEPDGEMFADEFVIDIAPLEGQVVDTPDAVSFEELRREYAAAVQVPDGLYRVRVFASRDGAYEPFVIGVEARADATPPAVLPLAVTVA